MAVFACTQNLTKSSSESSLTLGLHSPTMSTVLSAPKKSSTATFPSPILCASSATDVVGWHPFLERKSQLVLSTPAMCVTSVTLTSAARHSRVHTMDALVMMELLGLSVKAHVFAVMLSPLSASPLPESPSKICPATAIIAPVNSARFW